MNIVLCATYVLIKKIKAFSYNKKDLAWEIESIAMCEPVITNYWIYYKVNTNENYLNCHIYTKKYNNTYTYGRCG